MSNCDRTDCTKKLRSNNTTGHCATGCLSPEAPPSSRAKSVEGGKAPRTTAAPKSEGGTSLAKFHRVAAAMGIDAEAELEVFASTWLAGVRAALEE